MAGVCCVWSLHVAGVCCAWSLQGQQKKLFVRKGKKQEKKKEKVCVQACVCVCTPRANAAISANAVSDTMDSM